jgi:hypothetical protein
MVFGRLLRRNSSAEDSQRDTDKAKNLSDTNLGARASFSDSRN